MDITIKDRKIFIENKVISELDEFVLDFICMLEHFTEYVIVNGYVCILFGRARGTEDIDILIPSISDKKFSMLYNGFMEKEYFILNPEEESTRDVKNPFLARFPFEAVVSEIGINQPNTTRINLSDCSFAWFFKGKLFPS